MLVGYLFICLGIIIAIILLNVLPTYDFTLNEYFVERLNDNSKGHKIASIKNKNIKVTLGDNVSEGQGIFWASTRDKSKSTGPEPLFLKRVDTYLHLEVNVDIPITTTGGAISVWTNSEFTSDGITQYNIHTVNIDTTIVSGMRKIQLVPNSRVPEDIGYISASTASTIGYTYGNNYCTITFTGALTPGGTSQVRTVVKTYDTLYLQASGGFYDTWSTTFGVAGGPLTSTDDNILTINTGYNDFVYRSADDDGTIYTFSGRKI